MEILITRSKFESACQEVLARPISYVQDFVKECKIPKEVITSVVLVGGSSKLPFIQKKIRELLPNATIEAGVDPEVIVAEGAAIQAASMVRFFHLCLTSLLLK